MATYQNSRYNIALPSGAGGAISLLKTLTASSSSTLSFVDGSDDVVLDNTYRTYVFKWINIHPSGDGTQFSFQGNAAGGSGYDETITSAGIKAYHVEGDTGTQLAYSAGTKDQAQQTSFESLGHATSNDNDHACSGELWLFNPSSTTYVKHFIARIIETEDNNNAQDVFKAGYFNTTSAIDEIQFKFTSGTMDAGTIKLYGIT